MKRRAYIAAAGSLLVLSTFFIARPDALYYVGLALIIGCLAMLARA